MIALVARIVGATLAPWVTGAVIGGLVLLAVLAVVAWDNARLQAQYDAGRADERREWQAAADATDAANLRRDRKERREREQRVAAELSKMQDLDEQRGKEIDGYRKIIAAMERSVCTVDADLAARSRRMLGRWAAPLR